MKAAAHRFGTRVVGSIDVSALREGIASPGMDTRYWCSRGTVGTIDDQGEFHPDDPHAIWIGPEGVECDVKLEPLEQMVTALWSKGDAESSDISPIRPGDQVLVECPGGDLMTPVITHILHSRSAKQPMAAGVPIFDNKRRLVYLATTDFDLRCVKGQASIAAGPTSVWVRQDSVQLGAGDAAHPIPQGDLQKQALDAFLETLRTYAQGIQGFVDSGNIFTPPLLAGIAALEGALYLSPKTRTVTYHLSSVRAWDAKYTPAWMYEAWNAKGTYRPLREPKVENKRWLRRLR